MLKSLKKLFVLSVAVMALTGAGPAPTKPVKYMKMESVSDFSSTFRETLDAKHNLNRIYVVTLGAEWCGYCKKLKAAVEKWPNDGATPLSRVVWREIDVDHMDGKLVNAQIKSFGGAFRGALPTTFVLVNGQFPGQEEGLLNLNDLNAIFGEIEERLATGKSLQSD